MYRFSRTATVKTGSALADGLKLAAEISALLDKKYSVFLKHGLEISGRHTVHWYFESDSLDKMTELNVKLVQDEEYQALLERYKDVWREGKLNYFAK